MRLLFKIISPIISDMVSFPLPPLEVNVMKMNKLKRYKSTFHGLFLLYHSPISIVLSSPVIMDPSKKKSFREEAAVFISRTVTILT